MLASQHDAVGIVRNPDHRADAKQRGGQCVVLDLDAADRPAVVKILTDADVAVFAAGAGPGRARRAIVLSAFAAAEVVLGGALGL